ncbi:MAG: aminomethyl-transferring glycine dehydrogenase [Bacteroidota bacterium]
MSTRTDSFSERHIGISQLELAEMLATIGVESLEKLIQDTIPESIRINHWRHTENALSEHELLTYFSTLAEANVLTKNYIGLGYHPCITPSVILRNIFENPGWYTQYTPYQSEISQGRLEALLNYQTMVSDLTGLPVANASLLDEATAAAEAMSMLYGVKRKKDRKSQANTILVASGCLPQTLSVLQTRAEGLDINIVVQEVDSMKITEDVFAVLVQYPDVSGAIHDFQKLSQAVHEQKSYLIVAADLMSLSLLQEPGAFGADVAVGSTQRFGIPLGYGGPHAAFFATKEEFLRQVPGRIIGLSVDAKGNPALRMALQTREQHIRRDKATSNICTAQALLAIMSGMYAAYHGPEGIKEIAETIHANTTELAYQLEKSGYTLAHQHFFDTLFVEVPDADLLVRLKEQALANHFTLRFTEEGVGISVHEVSSRDELNELAELFARTNGQTITPLNGHAEDLPAKIPANLKRSSPFLTHPVFNSYHSETAMMRYIKSLENKDLSLNTAMIPLGSCTMKLNAATQLIPVSWKKFAQIHPFAPSEFTQGYQHLISELGQYLCEITELSGVSFQPNSGAQGEFAGLMVIKAYHKFHQQAHRDIALIPSSAHGTNPASAVMAGMKVVVVKCDEEGNIDEADLRDKVETHKENLSCLMITYPSTHGVFEESIVGICELIHENGGLVYMDGANMNAQVGLTSPGRIGADVCHLNLHKTFAIPHGGGGPGMGPICVNDKLLPFLPNHPLDENPREYGISAISATPFGSASILIISLAYIKMLGAKGLRDATEYAILNANYMKSRLAEAYDILFTGKNGHVAHEFIMDLRSFKQQVGLEVDDITKRLIDYGFHAPTVSWPVAGTIMVEPTESEPKAELDRFCDAMLSIKKEIDEIESGQADKEDNVLKNAPHTMEEITADNWSHSYTRSKAAFPQARLRKQKFWPSVGRVNNTYGDRNVVCTCPPIEAYEEKLEG